MKRVQAILALLATVCMTGAGLTAILSPGTAYAQTGSDDVPGQKNVSKDITISGWMRRSSHLPDLAAAYFTIVNKGHEAHLISGVTSPDCSGVEAYHSDQEVTSHTASLFSHFTVPAEMTMVFPEGGYHLICRDFPQHITPGQTVELTFSFLGGSKIKVPFPVR